MEDTITKLLAKMQKPPRHYRSVTFKLTDRQFMELESYCTVRYLNYTDVIRAAITEYLNK